MIHIHMQNTGRLCCFRYERFINFWLSSFEMRRETQLLKVYANHTMHTLPQRVAYLVMLNISLGRDLQNSTTCLNGQKHNYIFQRSKSNYIFQQSNTQLSLPTVEIQLELSTVETQFSFQNPWILWTISSGHDVIHTPVSFPVWGFIVTNGDCLILCERAWNAPYESKPYQI